MYSKEQLQTARQSRDARFDGLFFVAVKTTKIYCRPICPAPMAKEQHVEYFSHAHQAAAAGYRPCLRCRPDSAPGSYAWQGTATTADRAKRLIDEGALSNGTTQQLAERLGISVRHLNKLFQQYFATSPKAYALYKQCDFAKQLLQQTPLSVTDIAFASGFSSLRRFNDAFLQLYRLNPTQCRGAQNATTKIKLFLPYRPPYNWDALRGFLTHRLITGLEWLDEQSYGRTFTIDGIKGYFTAQIDTERHGFVSEIHVDDVRVLHQVVANIRRVLDLDANCNLIEAHFQQQTAGAFALCEGLRLPGIWSTFEAGIRAVLGQQVSVKAARSYVQTLVDNLGEERDNKRWFVNAGDLAQHQLDFFSMPAKRKQALRLLSEFVAEHGDGTPEQWLAIKGIGPWTVNYAMMRGQSHPDIFLAGDLGVAKALAACPTVEESQFAPFRSYLTFQLWGQL
ncbi:DNA-3-methyladenine glycosylase 2 family protein [Pseudoalteromonas fenneropenaei]|uniref:DNA-3-methyladenine glycosylase 2 family protein n=1 Tax=Pseudoalteromonas fenneropenaei TaxID=1737459 RepID=A0ABV7CQI1_9GAMM